MKKKIIGYENIYEIYDDGKIYSLDRYNIDKNGLKKFYPGKLLKQSIFTVGKLNYKRVGLSKYGVSKHNSVHRLVAKHFIPNPENKPFVNHMDNNGLNNSLDNLEWCTHSENMIHAQKQGRLFDSQSKGGTAGGATNRLKKIETVNKQIGKMFGNWRLLKCDESKSKAYAFCECLLCGEEKSVYFLNLKNGTSTMCKSCAFKKKYRDKKKIKI